MDATQTSSTSAQAPSGPRKARHLIDFDAPRPAPSEQRGSWSLTRVQRWVASTLIVTTALHMAAGASLAAMTLQIPMRSAQIGLNIIAIIFGVLGVAAGLAVHKHKILCWWLLLGALPGVIGMWLTLR